MTGEQEPQERELTPEQTARALAEVRDCVAILAAAQADRSEQNIAALLKVAGRLHEVPVHIEPDQQFEVLQAVCRFFLAHDKQLPFAMEAAQYLIRLARRLDRKPELLKGLFFQVVIATELDNHIEAVEACVKARELAVAMGDAKGELIALSNGAGVYINCGWWDSALDVLRMALTVADRCPEEDAARLEWLILGNIAQCHLFLRSFDEAERAVMAARALAPEPKDSMYATNRAVVEFTAIRALFAQGRGLEARPMLQSLAGFVEKAATPRSRIYYAVARSLIDLAEGRREIGFARLAAAIEKGSLMPSVLPDVLNATHTAYETEKMSDEAGRIEQRLKDLLGKRQETARLRADLVVEKMGVAGQTLRVSEYDRRLVAAREQLLRAGDS